MEKYAKLMKGLEMCAGPDCCKDACPYYGETRGGKTCRAWLLNDAAAAIANEEAGSETLQELLRNAEAERDKQAKECEELKDYALALEKEGQEARAERDKLHVDVDDLEAAANTLRAERDGLRIEVERMKVENEIMRQRCQVQQNEINALLLKTGKTDRPSAPDIELRKQNSSASLYPRLYSFRSSISGADGRSVLPCHH